MAGSAESLLASPGLEESLAECERVTRARAANFAHAFSFLDPRRRRLLFAVYAWCRLVDDLADDEDVALEERAAALDRERASLDALHEGAEVQPGPHAYVHHGLRHLFAETGARIEDFRDLIAGMKQDLSVTRYPDFVALYDYCYLAASSVGLICLEVFGIRSQRARSYGVSMGIALQLTNILRDVREDYERGRVYLPQDELAARGLSEAALGAASPSPELRAYLRDFARRAGRYYRAAEPLFPLVEPASRFCPMALFTIYKRLLAEILARDCDVLAARVSLSKRVKVGLVLGLWLRSWSWRG